MWSIPTPTGARRRRRARRDPAMAKVGVSVAPDVTFFPAHEVFLPDAVTLTKE